MRIYPITEEENSEIFIFQFRSVTFLVDCYVNIPYEHHDLFDPSPIYVRRYHKIFRHTSLRWKDIDVVLLSNYDSMVGLPLIYRYLRENTRIFCTLPVKLMGKKKIETLVSFSHSREQQCIPITLKPIIKKKKKSPGFFLKEYAKYVDYCKPEEIDRMIDRVETLNFNQQVKLFGVISLCCVSSGFNLGSCNWCIKTDYESIFYISKSSSLSYRYTRDIEKQIDTIFRNPIDVCIVSNISYQKISSEVLIPPRRIIPPPPPPPLPSSATEETTTKTPPQQAVQAALPPPPAAPSQTVLIGDWPPPENRVQLLVSRVKQIVESSGFAIIPCHPCGTIYDLISYIFHKLKHTETVFYVISPNISFFSSFPNLVCGTGVLSQEKEKFGEKGEDPFIFRKLVSMGRLYLYEDINQQFSRDFGRMNQFSSTPAVIFCSDPSLLFGPSSKLLKMIISSSSSYRESNVDDPVTVTSLKRKEKKKQKKKKMMMLVKKKQKGRMTSSSHSILSGNSIRMIKLDNIRRQQNIFYKRNYCILSVDPEFCGRVFNNINVLSSPTTEGEGGGNRNNNNNTETTKRMVENLSSKMRWLNKYVRDGLVNIEEYPIDLRLRDYEVFKLIKRHVKPKNLVVPVHVLNHIRRYKIRKLKMMNKTEDESWKLHCNIIVTNSPPPPTSPPSSSSSSSHQAKQHDSSVFIPIKRDFRKAKLSTELSKTLFPKRLKSFSVSRVVCEVKSRNHRLFNNTMIQGGNERKRKVLAEEEEEREEEGIFELIKSTSIQGGNTARSDRSVLFGRITIYQIIKSLQERGYHGIKITEVDHIEGDEESFSLPSSAATTTGNEVITKVRKDVQNKSKLGEKKFGIWKIEISELDAIVYFSCSETKIITNVEQSRVILKQILTENFFAL